MTVPRIALRPDDNSDPERMDDIVVQDVKMFRAEQLDDDHWWVACYLDDNADNRIVFDVIAHCRPRRLEWTVSEVCTPDLEPADFEEDGYTPGGAA